MFLFDVPPHWGQSVAQAFGARTIPPRPMTATIADGVEHFMKASSNLPRIAVPALS